MTLEELLTLPLWKRIEWLRSDTGPRGKLSHDKLAAKLGTTRQTVIGWEKEGREPSEHYAEKLAEFSGFPASAFRHPEPASITSPAPPDWAQLRGLLREELAAALADVEERIVVRLDPTRQAVGEDGP